MQRLLERLRSEFLEMPGLRLTGPQVQRFCGIDPRLCAALLEALVEERFLERRPDGTYVRPSVPHAAPAKAGLKSRGHARAS